MSSSHQPEQPTQPLRAVPTGEAAGAHVQVAFGAATDVGRVREHNEDAFLALPPVFAVADGMGGHAAGDVASRTVVEELAALEGVALDAEEGARRVAALLGSSQDRLEAWSREHGAGGHPSSYAGTTAVVALLVTGADGPAWLVANLGDSRAYRVVGGALEQVSTDHSLVQEMVDAGRLTAEEAAVHPERNVVTRAIGGPDRADADYFLLPPAGRLLLCSDGVTGMLSDDEVAGVLGAADNPREAAEQLVAAAVAAGGEDNATAVVVDVVGWSPTEAAAPGTAGDGGA